MKNKAVIGRVYNAKVLDLYNEVSGLYIKQGVKKNKQHQFEQSIQGRGVGVNGTYLMFDEVETYTFLQLYVYDIDRTINIDVRDYLKKEYNGRRLTKKFLAKVKGNMPRKIKVTYINSIWEVVDLIF